MKKQATLFPEHAVEVLAELELAEAEKLADQVKTSESVHCELLEIVGSIRRRKPKIHDVDFVAVAKSDAEWQKIAEDLKHTKARISCAGPSVFKAYVPCKNGLFQVDFYRATLQTLGINLLIRTGSAEHNTWLAGYAISKGMRLKYSEGLIKNGAAIAGETEEGVFNALGFPYPQPQEREIVDRKPVWLPAQTTGSEQDVHGD
jgi:DNA polymerase/3'-5' exonuclease PolX